MNVIHGGGVWDAENPSRWLDFSANLRPEGPPEWVREVMAEHICSFMNYYSLLGIDRELIRKYEKKESPGYRTALKEES